MSPDSKSTLIGQAAAALSNGAVFATNDEPLEQGTVLWYGIDEPLADTTRRLVDFGARPDSIVLSDSIPRPYHLEDALFEFEPRLVVIDTLADLWSGQVRDDCDAIQVNQFLRPYVQAVRESESALLLLHHMNKSGREFRGSTALAATVDATFHLAPPSRTEHRHGADAEDSIGAEDGRRTLSGRSRWGHVRLELSFSDGQYQLGDAPAPMAEVIFGLVASGRATTKNAVAALVRGRRQTVLAEIDHLVDSGRLTLTDGRLRGATRAETTR